MQNNKNIAVVGAGPAGLFAAGTARRSGGNVTLFEHNEKPGRKLLITGKGRCNVTNDCTPAEFLTNVVSNPRFLYSALAAMPPAKLMEIIGEMGTPLLTERGRRVFPVSGRSADILRALLRYAEGARHRHEHVSGLVAEDECVKGLVADGKEYLFDAVIIATGGLSYPATGCDGSGYDLARSVGHTVTPTSPSLVPLVSDDPACREMQGLSLKNVSLRVFDPNGKVVYEDFGEMLFTHFGVSGPMILSASAHIRQDDLRGFCLKIDLKPALDHPTLDRRVLSDFQKYDNRDLCHALDDLLPRKMIPIVIDRSGIDPHKKVYAVTREERMRLIDSLKSFCVSLTGRRPIEEAVITRGGVSVREVDPRTMESKLCRGLFFAGEILDLDAYTGGYNLQIAFSTGYLAGLGAVDASVQTVGE